MERLIKNILRTALALILGIAVGSVVNMVLILLGPFVIPPPPGIDMSTPQGLQASMHLLQPRHFVTPFVAHAAGTFAGALVAAVVAVSHRRVVALSIGALFLLGGIAASFMIPAPTWFIILDLAMAYLPMALLGFTVANRLRRNSAA